VTHHAARAVGALGEHPHRHRIADRRERAVRTRAQVDDQLLVGYLCEHWSEPRLPEAAERADAWQLRAAREAVRGDRVARAHEPEQRRAHGQARIGPSPLRAPKPRDVERFVEHARVAVDGRHRWCVEQVDVVFELVRLGASQAEHLGRAARVAPERGERAAEPLARGVELGE